MPFRIREDARRWFKDLRDKGFETDFDSFYFCFIAGIVMRQKVPATTSETAELVDYFPGRFRSRGRLLVALFLSRELEKMGVKMEEKKAVHTVISHLVNPESPNYLSDEGLLEFNKYAHGGFEVLLEWFDQKPRSLETFLRMYKRKVDSELSKEKSGSLM